MLDELARESLQFRSHRAMLTMMFHISHSSVALNQSRTLQQLGATTRGHQQRYRVPYCEFVARLSCLLGIFLPINNPAVEYHTSGLPEDLHHSTRIQEYQPTQPSNHSVLTNFDLLSLYIARPFPAFWHKSVNMLN
jgi:hypothetical protein